MTHSDAEQGRSVVAIPVKNEARHILPCLRALGGQNGQHRFEVLLLLNDCTDGTARVVHSASAELAVPVHVVECKLPPEASAGLTRKLAMQQAAQRIGSDGILLTTDADSRVAPDWVATNLAAIAAGADAVAGCAEIDAGDAARLPQRLHEAEHSVHRLATMLDEIAWLLDPDPSDPWPRHVQHSGASIAVTARMFGRSGGIPDVPLGEDRAFFRALRRVDARIRHCPQTSVIVSGRIHGRARGGMADTIRRRLARPDPWLDDCVEPAADAAFRATTRALARRLWNRGGAKLETLADALGIGVSAIRPCFQRASAFGAAWEHLEETSLRLRRRLVPVADLPAETRRAAAIRDALKSAGSPAHCRKVTHAFGWSIPHDSQIAPLAS